MRTDLLTSHESTTPIPSKAAGGFTTSESPGLQSNKGSDDNTQRMNLRVGNDRDMGGDVDVADQSKPDMRLL